MTHIRPLFSAAQALRSTFLVSSELQARRIRAPPTSLIPTRNYAGFSRSPRSRPGPPPPPPSSRPSNGPILNEKIQGRTIQINEGGTLTEPVLLQDALDKLDKSQFFLVQVAAPTPERCAICKIVTKAEMREKKSQTKKAIKAAILPTKRIELNWSIDAHDLQHRLGQLESFLEKGKRVELALMRKKGKRPATNSEADALIAKVREKIQEVGAVEAKPMTGKFPRLVEFVLDKPQSSS